MCRDRAKKRIVSDASESGEDLDDSRSLVPPGKKSKKIKSKLVEPESVPIVEDVSFQGIH